jgi:septal ring factor EnvC (AmiA/AmiB activator)
VNETHLNLTKLQEEDELTVERIAAETEKLTGLKEGEKELKKQIECVRAEQDKNINEMRAAEAERKRVVTEISQVKSDIMPDERIEDS